MHSDCRACTSPQLHATAFGPVPLSRMELPKADIRVALTLTGYTALCCTVVVSTAKLHCNIASRPTASPMTNANYQSPFSSGARPRVTYLEQGWQCRFQTGMPKYECVCARVCVCVYMWACVGIRNGKMSFCQMELSVNDRSEANPVFLAESNWEALVPHVGAMTSPPSAKGTRGGVRQKNLPHSQRRPLTWECALETRGTTHLHLICTAQSGSAYGPRAVTWLCKTMPPCLTDFRPVGGGGGASHWQLTWAAGPARRHGSGIKAIAHPAGEQIFGYNLGHSFA